MKVFNMTNFSVALALQAGAMGVPFMPTRTALGSDITKGNHFFYQIISPFVPQETLWAVRALNPTPQLFMCSGLTRKAMRTAGVTLGS